jgi:hypothetical protein
MTPTSTEVSTEERIVPFSTKIMTAGNAHSGKRKRIGIEYEQK